MFFSRSVACTRLRLPTTGIPTLSPATANLIRASGQNARAPCMSAIASRTQQRPGRHRSRDLSSICACSAKKERAQPGRVPDRSMLRCCSHLPGTGATTFPGRSTCLLLNGRLAALLPPRQVRGPLSSGPEPPPASFWTFTRACRYASPKTVPSFVLPAAAVAWSGQVARQSRAGLAHVTAFDPIGAGLRIRVAHMYGRRSLSPTAYR
jgi:hypothetical protein